MGRDGTGRNDVETMLLTAMQARRDSFFSAGVYKAAWLTDNGRAVFLCAFCEHFFVLGRLTVREQPFFVSLWPLLCSWLERL